MQKGWDNAIMISCIPAVKMYRLILPYAMHGKETVNKPLNIFGSENERLKWIS